MSERKGWVVVAWTITDRRARRGDEPHGPSVIEKTVPRACVWLRKGADEDVVKAEACMQDMYPETGRVFRYPSSERNPLKRAKLDVVAAC